MIKNIKELECLQDEIGAWYYTFGSSQSTAPGSITDRFIFTGKSTDNIPEIMSPEEFFMRSGNRSYLDKGGAEYIPSGFISVDGVGNVHLGKPLN